MKRPRNVLAGRLPMASVAILLSAASCAQLEGDQGPTVVVPGPTIEVSGAHSVVIGESLTLMPTTRDGQDASYTFTSQDASIATVDGTGVVTGVRVGETAITVTGDDSMATTSFAIVEPPFEPAALAGGNATSITEAP